LLTRLVELTSSHLLDAARALAATEQRGELEPERIAEVETEIANNPGLAPALASAVEAVGVSLGLTRQSLAWAVLVDVGDRARANASASLLACSAAIAERLTAARTHVGPVVADPEATQPARALRVFRSAAVSAAGPEVRARFLADRPEQLPLARALVELHSDPATLVDQFDAGVRALAQAGQDPSADPAPELVTDGPKRKFTIVHLILASIVLALTVWHYVLR
jgi:hypothetical protein